MTAMMKKLTRGLLAAAVLAIAGGSASAAVRADNFNDNVRANFWKTIAPSTTKVKETGSRLKFRSSSTGGGERQAAYASRNWTFRGDLTNKITFDYKINVANLTGNEKAAIGVWTAEPDDASALEVYILQDAGGWSVHLYFYGTNGNVLAHKQAPLNGPTGTVEIIYTQSNDKMRVKVNGQTKITMPNLNGNYGEFDLDLELFAWSQKTKFGYADVWMDNFRLTGTIDN